MGAGDLDGIDSVEAFMTLVDTMPVGATLLRWDDPHDPGSFRFVWVNESAKHVTGAGKGGVGYTEFLGRTLGECFPSLMTGPLPVAYSKAALTGELQSLGRFPLLRDNEPLTIFDVNALRVGRNVIAVLYSNVTRQVEAEERGDALVQDLKRSNQDLDKFAYVASHDLKAPLRDVDNLCQWIEEELPDDASVTLKEHVALMQRRVVRMEALLDDLLNYSRAGRILESSQPIVVDQLVANAVELAGSRGGFSVRLPTPTGMSIETPSAALEFVLRNLVSNALKHHDRESGLVEVSWSSQDAERLEFQVSDDGPGIDESFHERIFELFQTLRPRDQVEGTGMGLALVRKLVRAYGGEVTVESSGQRRGTTMRFTWLKTTPKRIEAGGFYPLEG